MSRRVYSACSMLRLCLPLRTTILDCTDINCWLMVMNEDEVSVKNEIRPSATRQLPQPRWIGSKSRTYAPSLLIGSMYHAIDSGAAVVV